MHIPRDFLALIYDQVRQEYPKECCGVILGPAKKSHELTRLVPCKNVQDAMHAEDPVNFPRTAANAYFLDPAALLTIQKAVRESREEIRVIYHSHINAGAYFSEEDKRMALSAHEPTYPGVAYLVVSVNQGQVADSSLYRWSKDRKDFLREEITP